MAIGFGPCESDVSICSFERVDELPAIEAAEECTAYILPNNSAHVYPLIKSFEILKVQKETKVILDHKDQGDKGDIGPRGPEGLQGDIGPQGLKGEKEVMDLKDQKGNRGRLDHKDPKEIKAILDHRDQRRHT